jgi:hypothetical protein
MECEKCSREFDQESNENLCPDCMREWQACILPPGHKNSQKAKMNFDLEQITLTGKPRRENLTTKPKLEYKLIGYFDTHRVNDALKVEAYLNKDPYVAKPVGHSLVAIYKKIYR